MWDQISSQGQANQNFNVFEDAWKAVESLEFNQSETKNEESSSQLEDHGLDDNKFVYSKVCWLNCMVCSVYIKILVSVYEIYER